MILYTDFVLDQNLQFYFGWYLIGFTITIFLYNLIFIIKQMVNILKMYIRLIYNHLSIQFDKIIHKMGFNFLKKEEIS